MAEYTAGSASVPITPDMSGFHTQIAAELDTLNAQFAQSGEQSGKSFSDAFTTQLRTSFASLPSPTVTASADTAAAAAQFDSLAADRTATVDANADTSAATVELDALDSGRTTKVIADADTTAATVKLDALTRDRTVKVTVKEDTSKGLPGGGGSGGAAGGLGSLSELTGPLLAAGGTVAAALLPAATGTAVGAGFAGIGLLAASKFSTSLQQGLAQTGQIFEGVLGGAVAPLGQAFQSLLPSIDSFIQSMGPQLTAAFNASIPFLQEFVTIGENAAQTLLPAFTDLMNTLAPELPQIGQAFDSLIQGVSGFLEVLGPGMSASVTVFKAAADIVSFAMVAIGGTAGGIAIEFADVGHGISVAFSAIAGAASATASAVTTGWNAVVNFFQAIPGKITGFFSSASSLLVNAGKSIISGLSSSVTSAWSTVASFFTSLPGKIAGFFSGAGSWLLNAGKAIVNGLISGIKSVPGIVGNALLDLIPSSLRAAASTALGFIGFASGTPAAPPGWAWVGEQGPELVRFSGGEQVKTSAASLSMASQAQSMASLASLGVPSISAAPRLPGVSSPLSGSPLQMQVSVASTGNALTDAVVGALQFHIQGNAGGDVQAALGRGPVRIQ